ncbi:hypothetical protein N7532_009512 [Penicillium argentinense]|uniref:TNFR-Cys domain-containing protein n=1 Tax=Penicillium argentinense TaxID=1131581 RepID=A0A9W9EZI8_9EURO|nr:uncharacterized protein N7532_009512 [Penicillium argentinense]KAJ5090828.1 hypothetical protein N7532_009512 [Penicillium argentinense]
MVRPFLFLVVLALLACHVPAQAQDSCYSCKNQEKCDQTCQDCGGKADPRGIRSLIKNDMCKRCAHCTGEEEPYTDTQDKTRLRCEEKVDADTGEDKCGDEDHHPLYDTTTNEGFCCPVGVERYENAKCKSESPDDPDDPDDDHHCGDKVCPEDHHDLGFEYGSCCKIKDIILKSFDAN